MTIDTQLILGEYRIRSIAAGRWRENCYIVHHVPSSDAVIVDPGEEPHTIAEVLRVDQSRPRYILLTHAHYDHVGGIAALGREFRVPFYLHPADAKLLRRAPLYAMSFEGRGIEVPGDGRDVTQVGLSVAGQPLRTLHVPGHTEGGMAYGFDGFAFTGDTLLFEKIGRTDLPGGNHRQLLESVARLLDWTPYDALLLPGHGPSWKTADARAWWRRESGRDATETAVKGGR